MKIRLRKWENISIRGGATATFTSKRLLINILEFVDGSKGQNFAENRKRMKLLDKVEALPDDATELEINNDEYIALKNFAAQMRWAIAHKFLIEFESDLNGLSVAETKELTASEEQPQLEN